MSNLQFTEKQKQGGFYFFSPKKEPSQPSKPKRKKHFPVGWSILLLLIVLGCVFADLLTKYPADYLNTSHAGMAPCLEHPFGTDFLGRDLFSMIWYGGRVSLTIGLIGAGISAVIAFLYGGISGFLPDPADRLLMRIADLLLSMPSVLLVIFLGALFKTTTVLSLSIVIGVTGWISIAKIVRSEVRQLRNSGYILAAKSMGAGFFYLLRRHLFPNLLPSVLFMMVTNIGTAIASEATLSFLGIGLPIESISWGTMLAQADRAMLSNYWWMVVIPGIFLVLVLIAVMEIGNYFRKETITSCGNLT